MGAAVARVALKAAARSRDVEAGGVTRDSNAHSTASLSLSTRWSREKSRPALPGHQGSRARALVSTGTPERLSPDRRSPRAAWR
jgi:hypothetical protein